MKFKGNLFKLTLSALVMSSFAASAYGEIEVITSQQQLDKILSKHHKVIVKFHKKTCPLCIAAKHHDEILAEKYGDQVKLVFVDISQTPEIADQYDIKQDGVYLFLHKGETVTVTKKHTIKEELEAKIKKLITIDTVPWE